MRWIKKQQKKLRAWWWRFTYEIKERWPFFCPRCHEWTQYRHTAQVQMTSGQWVRVCHDCKKELYSPWS